MKANEKRAQWLHDESQPREDKLAPNGLARSALHFGAEFRGENVIWNGSERRKVEGYASIVDRKYRMYDMFGEYEELMMPGAFDKTLSKNPDVAYLINHRGITMARTTNGSLELRADDKGLWSTAYLNPKRSDVQDLLVAIEDKDITEMSFAFMIENGQWNEDYTEFRIHEVNIDRGDVSAVNYGANPYTSVKARQREIIQDFRSIPRGAQEEAMRAAGLIDLEEIDREVASRGQVQVDSVITDPDTLITEQWLARMELNRRS